MSDLDEYLNENCKICKLNIIYRQIANIYG